MSGDLDDAALDLGEFNEPEAEAALLVVADEVNGTTTVYEISKAE